MLKKLKWKGSMKTYKTFRTNTQLSSLLSLISMQVNESERRGVGARTLFGKLADQEDGRLMSQNNHLVWV